VSAIFFLNVSPVAANVFGFDIYWYAFAYLFGFLFAYIYIKRLNNISKCFKPDNLEDLSFYIVLGIILGGRLGYCLIYDFDKLLGNPLWVLNLRSGGMSFHGGLFGVIVAMIAFSKKYEIKLLKLSDIIAPVVTIGLFLGRVANFINQEMFGRPTSGDWGVIYSRVDSLARHPSQLYEAVSEGLILGMILFFIYPIFYKRVGFSSGVFLSVYAIFRFVSEYFKTPEYNVEMLTIGQLLSIPMFFVGIFIINLSLRNKFMK